MKILVVNSGSSSIKFKFFEMPGARLLAAGSIERIGQSNSRFQAEVMSSSGTAEDLTQRLDNHREGLEKIIAWFLAKETGLIDKIEEIDAVGHRVVHGADYFQAPTRINSEVLKVLNNCTALAPLHNPANILGIEVATTLLPHAPQVAIFDTAFHQSIPDYAYRYAVPESFYTDYKVRRYGFHGTSHSYVAKEAAKHLGQPLSELNLITIHLGNGASMSAIRDGESVDTTMGLTPLEGLIMGTRCGDLDPAIPFYMMEEAGLNTDEIDNLLNKKSGLKGICDFNDMRDIEDRAAKGEAAPTLALNMFCYRVKKYIGAYAAVLGRLNGIIFTAGIGENSNTVRKLSCEGLGILGIEIDDAKNEVSAGKVSAIQKDSADVPVLVIQTNEELEIAQQTLDLLNH